MSCISIVDIDNACLLTRPPAFAQSAVCHMGIYDVPGCVCARVCCSVNVHMYVSALCTVVCVCGGGGGGGGGVRACAQQIREIHIN